MTRKCATTVLSAFLCVAGLFLSIGCDADFWNDDGGSTEGVQGEGGGFLWKPVSESDGNLVVLLPPQYRGRATSAFVLDSGGTLLDRGIFTGDTHNGNRPHYRFPKPGRAYGGNLKLVADLNDGGPVFWPIPNGAARIEY